MLKVAAGYDSVVSHFHPTTLKKRQLYIRCTIKLLITCTTRYKPLLTTNPKVFNNTLSKMLDDMEAIILNSKYDTFIWSKLYISRIIEEV